MVASLQGVKVGSLVHRFITSGKPGRCELCGASVEKLEAHHISYKPEITIDLCHNCHHKAHFWPNRLSHDERLKLLLRKFPCNIAHKLADQNNLGIAPLAKLIAPSRNRFIHKQQMMEENRLKIEHEKEVINPAQNSLKKSRLKFKERLK